MVKAIGIISANYRSDLLETLSSSRPVGAVPFGGRYRLIDFALSSMVNSGIRTVGIITPYRYRPISDHLGAGKEWSLDRKTGGLFILPGATPDLQFRIYKFCLKDFAANIEYLRADDVDYVVISGCNYIYNINFNEILEAHEKSGATVTLAYKNMAADSTATTAILGTDKKGRVSQVIKAGQRYTPEEKTKQNKHFADIFIFNRLDFIDMIESCVDVDFTDLLDMISANLKNLNVQTHELTGYLGQIYSVSDYYRSSMDMLNPGIRAELFMGKNKIHTKIKDNPPTKYEENISVNNSLISSGCIVKGEVSDSVIFRACRIERGAVIKNSIIMQKCFIGKDCVIENVIMDKAVSVSEGAVLKGFKYRPMLVPKGTKL